MDDTTRPNVERYPEWEAALEQFVDEGRGPGDLLTWDWLHAAFGITDPELANSVRDYRVATLYRLELMNSFQLHLQEEQQLHLRSLPGVGYKVMSPAEQAAWAAEELHSHMNKAFRKARRRIIHVRMEELSDEQRRHHNDAAAKIGRMQMMVRRPDRVEFKSSTIRPRPRATIPSTAEPSTAKQS